LGRMRRRTLRRREVEKLPVPSVAMSRAQIRARRQWGDLLRSAVTWVWLLGSLRGLVTTVLLPIVVWLVQYIMERTLLP